MDDPLIDLATAVSDLTGQLGIAFVEDHHVAALAAALRSFLDRQGIPIDEERLAEYHRAVRR